MAGKRKRLCKAFVNSACDLLGLFDRSQIAKDDRKLVSTDTCDGIGRIQHSHKTLSRDHQNLVADRVAKRVVDVLESANIKK